MILRGLLQETEWGLNIGVGLFKEILWTVYNTGDVTQKLKPESSLHDLQ